MDLLQEISYEKYLRSLSTAELRHELTKQETQLKEIDGEKSLVQSVFNSENKNDGVIREKSLDETILHTMPHTDDVDSFRENFHNWRSPQQLWQGINKNWPLEEIDLEIPDFTPCCICEKDAIKKNHSTCIRCGRMFHHDCLQSTRISRRRFSCRDCKTSKKTAISLGLRSMNDLENFDKLNLNQLELAYKQTERDKNVNDNRRRLSKLRIMKERAVTET